MLANLLSVGRWFPDLPVPERVAGVDGTNRNGVPVRTAVWVVTTICIERIIFDEKAADGAKIWFGIMGVTEARSPFVLGVEPAGTAAIGPTIGH